MGRKPTREERALLNTIVNADIEKQMDAFGTFQIESGQVNVLLEDMATFVVIQVAVMKRGLLGAIKEFNLVSSYISVAEYDDTKKGSIGIQELISYVSKTAEKIGLSFPKYKFVSLALSARATTFVPSLPSAFDKAITQTVFNGKASSTRAFTMNTTSEEDAEYETREMKAASEYAKSVVKVQIDAVMQVFYAAFTYGMSYAERNGLPVKRGGQILIKHTRND